MLDALQEVEAFHFERFFLFQIGRGNVAIMVGILKLRESIIVRRPFDAHVEDPDLLVGHGRKRKPEGSEAGQGSLRA